VHLWAVEKIARSPTVLREIPAFLTTLGVRVTVVPDRGPITKLLPALATEHDPIILADDDLIYGAGWAAGLLNWAAQIPGAALGYCGRQFDVRDYGKCQRRRWHQISAPCSADVLMAWAGALYYRDFFAADTWDACPTNDDIMIAAHLKRRNVPMYVVPGSFAIKKTKLCIVHSLASQNQRNGHQLNNECMHRLL